MVRAQGLRPWVRTDEPTEQPLLPGAPMADEPSPSPPPAPVGPRLEPWLLLGLAAVLMLVQSPMLGIWEPWESDVASVVDAMRGGHWMQVLMPAGEQTRAVAELPYGLWPSAVLSMLFGTGELALRLPGLLLSVGVVLLTFVTTRRVHGRFAAWFAALGLLCMPLFVFHGRLAFGTAVAMNLSALAALAWFQVHGGASKAWGWLAWLALAGAGLAGGAPAMAGPLAVLVVLAVGGVRAAGGARVERPMADRIVRFGFLAAVLAAAVLVALGELRWGGRVAAGSALLLAVAFVFGSDGATLRQTGAARRFFPWVPATLAVVLLGLGWWGAVAALDDGLSIRALLLWADGLDGAAVAAERPPFDMFVLQIGYGLFPLAAFLPLAFADLIWHPRYDDEPSATAVAGPALLAWFALGFLGPALGAPIGQAGFFLAAPAAAIAAGVWFGRALRSPPQPLQTLVAVVLLALLDSNLKHQTQALADALVTGKVDAFPPTLPYWEVARLLDLGLLAVLMIYQGGLLRLLRPAVLAVFYPIRRLSIVHPAMLAFSAMLGLLGVVAPRGLVEKIVTRPEWGRLVPGARWFAVFLVVWLVCLVGLHLVHTVRVRRLGGQRDGMLLRLADGLEAALRRPRAPWWVLGGVLVAWGSFLNLVVASTLTTNFSQKDIFDRYGELAHEGEPLLKYLVAERGSSFYADQLEALDPKAFRERATATDRFFALVPRKELARINNEFRGATGRTVPVLDDSSFRFLLVSNQLNTGEEDRNPITRALLTELPPGVNATSINFDNQIELVGWALDPAEPHPGSELTFKLYWKATKKVSGRWKVFVHLDAPGQRVHGDHDPVEGLFPTDNWKVGDLVQDEHLVVVNRSTSSARFTLYVGLYRGDTRMNIVAGDKDNENRARVGTVNVR